MKKILLFITLISIAYSLTSTNNREILDLSTLKWEYRWGDSPFKNRVPLWSLENSNSKDWEIIEFPSNPPNREGKTKVWYRVKLPEILPKDPNLYIYSVDIITQVYLDGKEIYHYGSFNKNGEGTFEGWPWHLFSLGENSAGKYLYFRVYSNYRDIGLWGEILISSEGTLLKRVMEGDIPKLLIGSITTFIALIFILSFMSKLKRVELIILGLLFLTQGLNLLCSVKKLDNYIYFILLYISIY